MALSVSLAIDATILRLHDLLAYSAPARLGLPPGEKTVSQSVGGMHDIFLPWLRVSWVRPLAPESVPRSWGGASSATQIVDGVRENQRESPP